MNNSPVSNDITLEKKPSKKRVYTFLAMLFAFASALLLWFYVLGYDSPYYEKEFNVPVNVEGESTLRENMGYTVLSDFSFTIKVTVSGTQTEVNKLRSSDIKAYVDVSGVTVPGNITLPISVTVSNENEITVVKKSVESAVIFIDKNVVAEIPVRIEIADYSLASGYNVGDYTTSPVTVTVEGPESELSKISYARGIVQPGTLMYSTQFNTSVELYDEGGNKINNSYMNLKDTSVIVKLPVYKTVNLPVRVYFVGGYLSTESATIIYSDDYITVKGPVEDFEGLTEIKMNIAENTLTSGMTIEKDINLPEGIECVSGQKTVSATITFKDIVIRSVAASCSAVCDIVNAPADMDVTVVTANLNVNFMGPVAGLLNLTQNSFRAVVDLANMTLEPGKTYNVPITVKLKEDDSGLLKLICPSGDYSVTISVNSKGE